MPWSNLKKAEVFLTASSPISHVVFKANRCKDRKIPHNVCKRYRSAVSHYDAEHSHTNRTRNLVIRYGRLARNLSSPASSERSWTIFRNDSKT